ncbi:MAG: histidine phosphatase family protein [Chloroflexi bacterium]|nr:histidine phosphatase family protein [Chloroflexota bacterium]
MTVYYLIRHGCRVPEVSGDVGLSPLGRRQAEATAAHLAKLRPAALYASPLRRAQETAEAFAAVFGLPIITAPELRERANWGDDPEQSWGDYITMIERSNVQRSWQPPVGDSSRAAGDRMARFLREMAPRYTSRNVVVISHGAIISDFLLNVTGRRMLKTINPAYAADPYGDEIMRECSITVVHYDGINFLPERITAVDHLAAVAE